MKKVVKKMSIALCTMIVLSVMISYTNHAIRLHLEANQYPPLGQLVEVNGHNMHVYTEGEGSTTLVFMSGAGTSSPTLDFKPLYAILSKDYRIAVVEKAGYGWSEPSKMPRDMDSMLEETRQALALAGEKGPFVLFPHSMSGLESIYWAQKYPAEVTAIIGLDCAVPEVYDDYDLPSVSTYQLISFAANTGFTRFFPAICDSSPAIQHKQLSADETKMYRAVFYRSTLTADMLEEMKVIKENAIFVKEKGIPVNTPMYFFISKESNEINQVWSEKIIGYAHQLTQGGYTELDCGHYVHDMEPERIALESKRFIEQIME